MKIKEEIKTEQHKEYIITLTENEIHSLIYLLSEVKGDWYLTDETEKILKELKEIKNG